MTNKIKLLFSSIRFWQLLIASALQVLVVLNIINGEQGIGIANIISGFLGASVFVGTVDKRSAAVAGTTTVSIPKNVSTVTATTE